MKRSISLFLSLILLLGVSAGCAGPAAGGTPEDPAEAAAEAAPALHTYDDGRARPSSCGKLRVLDGKLCAADGETVIAFVRAQAGSNASSGSS